MKGLKSLHLKAEAYLELFRENSEQRIIFAKRTPSLIVKDSVCKRGL